MTEPQSTPVQLPLQIEEWRPVVGYEGRYEVSNRGLVRRADTHRPLAWHTTNKYPRVGLSRDGEHRTIAVHRLVAAAFLGPCPAGCEVNHRDGNKANAAVGNLEYVTPRENREHAIRTGLALPLVAVRHVPRKLTADEVRAIRRSPLLSGALAEIYGVGSGHIRAIRRRVWWREVE